MHDLRMVLPALAVWGGGAWLVTVDSRIGVGVAVIAVAVTGGLLVAVGRRAAGPAVVAVCLAAVAASCGWRVAAVEHSPLTGLAAQRVTAVLEVEVRVDAHTFVTRGTEQSVVGVTIRRAVARGVDVRASGRATAFLDGPADDLVVGRRVVLRGQLAPSSSTDEVAVVRVTRRGPTDAAAWWWEGSEHVRAGVRSAVEHVRPEPRALVPALVDGDDGALSEQVQEDFRRSGLTHLLAVSGTNLTIVLAMVVATGRAVGVRRRGLWVLGAVAVAAFVLLARPEPSVVRAAAMGAVGLAATGYGSRGGVRALSWAVVVLVFVDPWLARSAGFVLSVCATAGILVLAPVLARTLARSMPRWLAVAIAVPTAAQLACTPALAAISGEVSLVAVVANLLAGPAVAPATIAGLVGGLVAVVSEPVARLPGSIAGWCASWILTIGHAGAGVEGASVAWRAPWPWLLLVVPLAALALISLSRRPALLAGLALGVMLAMWRPPTPGWPPSGWVMVSCDVGQGDGIVVSTGPGEAMVVDVGERPRPIDHCLDRLGIDHVRLLVLTHGDADHVDGWRGAVRGRQVDQVLVGASGGPPIDAVPRREAVAGESFSVGDVDVHVLWPPTDAIVGDDRNVVSLVLDVRTHGARLLLTGDIGPEQQDRIVRTAGSLRADVVTMPHHGSAAQSPRFFDAVRPTIATISAGRDNDYGHPAPAALQALRAVGARWWRTDRDGDLAIVVREGRLAVVTRH